MKFELHQTFYADSGNVYNTYISKGYLMDMYVELIDSAEGQKTAEAYMWYRDMKHMVRITVTRAEAEIMIATP